METQALPSLPRLPASRWGLRGADKTQHSILLCILNSIALPVAGAVALNFIFGWSRWYDLTLHDNAEGVEAFGTLILGCFLYVQQRYERNSQFLRWVVAALIALAGLEFASSFSAFQPALNWSRTYGHLLAGFLLLFLWAPPSTLKEKLESFLYPIVTTATFILIAQLIFFPAWMPPFTSSEAVYAPAFQATNLVAGMAFLLAAAFFIFRFQDGKGRSNLVLAYYFSLIGVMRILLITCHRWTAAWWFVYGMRLTATLVVLYYLFLIFRQTLETVVNSKKVLEDQVSHRTKDLAQANASLQMEVQEKNQAEERLKEAVREAKEANALKSSFLANMSHEIRTPLSAILGFSDLLRDPQMPLEEKEKYFEIIHRNGEQLSSLINDILDLSKVEAGQVEVERLPVNIRQLTYEMVANLSIQAQKKNLALSCQIDPSIPERVGSDPTRLKQILNNIIGNAIKFTDRGSVSVRAFMKEEKIHFQVKDTGVGLSQEQIGKLFNPFTQADESTTRKFGGTGLGLVLSKKLAQALGGDLVIQSSSPGKGSTFEIIIEDRIDSAPSLQGLNILVVDDSLDVREWASHVLEDQKAHVETSDNGLTALDKVSRENYDLILMDLQMPVMDGLTAIRKLRERGFRKPIIALTVFGKNEVFSKCLSAGCTDQLTKPVRPSDLTKVVTRYLHPA